MARSKKPDALTPAERSRNHRTARLADGWTEPTVRLSPENTAWARREITRRPEVTSVAALINDMMDKARR